MYPLKRLFCIACLLFFLSGPRAYASHVVGGEMTYKFKGDAVVGGVTVHRYEINLTLFIDCASGQPEAIAQDVPVYLAVYDGSGNAVKVDTDVYPTSDEMIPAKMFTKCGPIFNLPNVCLRKKVFLKTYDLPANTTGYTVAYQRCCRNANILNIQNPSETGVTYACTIPGTVNNNSAVFNNYPPQINCINEPFHFYNSAEDADGDSLSYSLCNSLLGASDADIKPIPKAPPYSPVNYLAPYTSGQPLDSNPLMNVDPVTGLVTGTPNRVGRYLVAICCNEWRAGVLINTMTREFQIVISDCSIGEMANYKPVAGESKVVSVGEQVQFNAYGGISYEWEPATYLSDPHVAVPVAKFPEEGVYTYVLRAVSDSGCVGSDTLRINVVAHSGFVVPSAFSPNGDLLNDILKPIAVGDATLIRFRVFDRKGVTVYGGGIVAPKGWDGTYLGVPQDVGVYFWQLHYKDNSGVYRFLKGEVTLIR